MNSKQIRREMVGEFRKSGIIVTESQEQWFVDLADRVPQGLEGLFLRQDQELLAAFRASGVTLVTWENFHTAENTLNPGRVHVTGDRSKSVVLFPFVVLKREWAGPGAGFVDVPA